MAERLSDAELTAFIGTLDKKLSLGNDVQRALIADLRVERAESQEWREKYEAERDEGVRVVTATLLRADELIEAERAETAQLLVHTEALADALQALVHHQGAVMKELGEFDTSAAWEGAGIALTSYARWKASHE